MIKTALDILLHIDKYLGAIISSFGPATYIILFLIIFAETGLVFTPFLPGDSLLFVIGSFSSQGYLSLPLILFLLILAAILGDTINYRIGNKLGRTIVSRKMIKTSHLEKTRRFFSRHGKKTIVLARFVPIVRTFAPFMAGLSNMPYPAFIIYNIVGGILWVSFFTLLGYFFGTIPYVQQHFGAFVIIIIIISFIPLLIELIKAITAPHNPPAPK